LCTTKLKRCIEKRSEFITHRGKVLLQLFILFLQLIHSKLLLSGYLRPRLLIIPPFVVIIVFAHFFPFILLAIPLLFVITIIKMRHLLHIIKIRLKIHPLLHIYRLQLLNLLQCLFIHFLVLVIIVVSIFLSLQFNMMLRLYLLVFLL